MPFQSEKQRRYLHANHPEIANRWEKKYGLGGIAELNSQLNSLPEYYLPKNQGGRIGFDTGTPKDFQKFLNERNEAVGEENLDRLMEDYKRWLKGQSPQIEEAAHGGLIPSHEAGIYGLSEGGRTGFFTGMREAEQQAQSSGGGGGDAGHLTHNVPVSLGGTKPDPRPTGDSDGRTQALINISKQKKRPTYTGTEDLEEQLVVDQQNALNRLKYDRNLTKNERENLEVGLGFRPPKQKRSIWKTIGMGAAIITGVAPLLGFQAPAAVQTVAQLNALHNKANQALATFNMINKTDHTLESLFNQVKNIKTADQKLMESLPKGHPERIALEAKMKIKKPPKGPDGEGGDKVNITMDVEAVNDANADKVALEQKYQEMDEASYAAWLRQQEMQAKKQAYLKNFRQMYMSAQGGRVPQGYNTGGLSNLFRLKNR